MTLATGTSKEMMFALLCLFGIMINILVLTHQVTNLVVFRLTNIASKKILDTHLTME